MFYSFTVSDHEEHHDCEFELKTGVTTRTEAEFQITALQIAMSLYKEGNFDVYGSCIGHRDEPIMAFNEFLRDQFGEICQRIHQMTDYRIIPARMMTGSLFMDCSSNVDLLNKLKGCGIELPKEVCGNRINL